jgi:hypothetical protein
MQHTLPHLVETIQTRDPPTLLQSVKLVGIGVKHNRGH